MAKHEFNLPGIQDLSKEQEYARALPKQGQHLIIGGPGTGKSVLALLRSRRHQQDKDDYIFLVYNKLLNQASRQLFGMELCSQQWQSWFARIFKAASGEAVPKLPSNGNGWQEIDWVRTSEIIAALPIIGGEKHPFLIIDEGQDMPPEFYQALFNLGFENVYAVADQNQQIVPGQNSTRQEIQNGLGIAPNDVIELQDNYRNSRPIARLAREFYTGDPASPPPALPNRPSAIRPILYTYEQSDFQNLIERILKNADTTPEKLIGLIAPNNKTRERYFEALMKTKATVKFDNVPPAVQTYLAGSSPDIPFNEGGIMVINAQSCKGLEFDTVFLADINQHFCNTKNQDQTKRLFYVMVARAKERVIMLKEAGKHCPVDAILPQDTDILERK
ncbi:MAG: ATP-binding domain-containing protein [Candidatus Accumulibacter sp.]|uniref:3'-5' exonuclease n=1 Tax=Accumulibacter sp. TaxID=2053492 RepID=UPI0025894F46|nr:3'-5' exonuclease [Accumulibacter sp.]MBK8114016.1 ATP-binding domain-containing protein [Accumulibacter sp.]